jgi:predicted nucleic acid-binding protein
MRHWILADTGPLFALVDPSDQHAGRAAREAASIRESDARVVVLHATILEAYSLILRQLGTHYAQRWLAFLQPNTGLIPVADEYYEAAFALIQNFPDQDMTLFDALLHTVSVGSGMPIWTFDHHFDILGSSRWYPGA